LKLLILTSPLNKNKNLHYFSFFQLNCFKIALGNAWESISNDNFNIHRIYYNSKFVI